MSKKLSITFIILTLGLIALNEFALTSKSDVSAHEVKFGETKSTGEALIGGAFSLVDQNGNTFTQENLEGKYSLVYFGFTHCPDICPTALSNMTLALQELGDKAKDFQIVFITADPERDNVKTMKEYVSNFGGNIIGLTGTKEQVDAAEQVYKVYAEKVTLERAAKGEYDISHSSIIYIMDKSGKFISNLSHESKVDDIAAKLKTFN